MYQYVWSTDSTTTTSSSTSSSSNLETLVNSPENHNNNNNNNNSNNNNKSSSSLPTLITSSSNQQSARSTHLLQLQKEIKEEEEEIFADINSLINGGSNLYSTLGPYDDENTIADTANEQQQDDVLKLEINDDDRQKNSTISSGHNNHDSTNNNNNNNTQFLGAFRHHASTTSADDQLFANDSDYNSHSADDTISNDYQNESREGLTTCESDIYEDLHHKHHFHHNITRNHHKLFSEHKSQIGASFEPVTTTNDGISQYIHLTGSQLDDPLDEDLQEQLANHENNPEYVDSNTLASCNQNDQQDYETLQAVIQQVTSNLPKPCVFFLEGNCRRSDCKYSHDLSNITCKYWIEGFCFKGEMCPFLHSYSAPNESQEPNSLDEEGLKSLSKKELNPTFVIESEADFPSLPLDAPTGTLSDSTKSCINTDAITTNMKNQILSSNPAVVFKTLKKKRKRG